MEALTAVSVAALTIYDMVKAIDKKNGDRSDKTGEEDRRPVRRLLRPLRRGRWSWNLGDSPPRAGENDMNDELKTLAALPFHFVGTPSEARAHAPLPGRRRRGTLDAGVFRPDSRLQPRSRRARGGAGRPGRDPVRQPSRVGHRRPCRAYCGGGDRADISDAAGSAGPLYSRRLRRPGRGGSRRDAGAQGARGVGRAPRAVGDGDHGSRGRCSG